MSAGFSGLLFTNMNRTAEIAWTAAMAIALSLLAEPVAACSCRAATLQNHYDSAETIVVAKVSGCAAGKPDERGQCRNREWAFQVVEDLKGAREAITPERRRLGGTSTCDLGGEMGKTYLLFLRADSKADICDGSGSLEGDEGIRRKQDLEMLREYRDGVSKDLSGPWNYRDDGWACTIDHRFGEAAMRFAYVYAGPQPVADDQHGRAGFDWRSPTLSAWPVYGTMVGPTLFQVDGTEHILSRQVMEISLPQAASVPFARDQAAGDAAMALLEQMAAGVEVLIAGTTANPTTRSAAIPFRSVTRTTRLAAAATKFKACIAAHPAKPLSRGP
jgi:hypothetical protein